MSMWTRELLGTDVYHLVAAFVVYSIMGWIVESIYMSFCNKKLTNRGFAKGPFCPIYGFGAVCGYLILSPLKGQYMKLYFAGAILATIFEYLVGRGMIKFLGQLWWDYNEKPFNYQGIICLESTVAWGFYAIGIIEFLHGIVYRMIDRVNFAVGVRLIQVILFVVAVDYAIQLLNVFQIDLKEKRKNMIERCQSFIARWS